MIPREALDFIKRKQLRTEFSYLDIWNEEHATAFSVAKAMQVDVLTDIKSAVESAIENGETFRSFANGLAPTLQSKGWWGKKETVDPLTGELVPAQLGSMRRLRTIYRTNLRTAYSYGRWQRGQESTAHTHILYLNGPSRNHRKQHRAWHGLLLPKDDPFWDTHFPPNGWGCKCYARFVTRRTADRLQRDGIRNPVTADGRGGGSTTVTTKRPSVSYRTFVNRRTGATERIPVGIDPGFAWNPGAGRSTVARRSFAEKDRELSNTLRPSAAGGTPVSDRLVPRMRGHRREAYERVVAAIRSVHGDGPLPKLDVKSSSSTSFHGAFRYVPGGAPGDIRIASGDHLELTVAHEIGHFLDYSGLPGGGFTSLNRLSGAMNEVLSRSVDTDTFRTIGSLPRSRAHYLTDPCEVWARAYAQYVAYRSGDGVMMAQLNTILQSETPGNRLTQWTHAEFASIAQAIDDMFEDLGWRNRR